MHGNRIISSKYAHSHLIVNLRDTLSLLALLTRRICENKIIWPSCGNIYKRSAIANIE